MQSWAGGLGAQPTLEVEQTFQDEIRAGDT